MNNVNITFFNVEYDGTAIPPTWEPYIPDWEWKPYDSQPTITWQTIWWWNCPECGTLINGTDQWNYCPYCGWNLSETNILKESEELKEILRRVEELEKLNELLKDAAKVKEILLEYGIETNE